MKTTLLTFLLTVYISYSAFSQITFTKHVIDSSTESRPFTIESGHLDNDSNIDIVIGTYNGTSDVIKWYKNDGSGNFELQATVSSTILNVGGLHIADVDGVNGNDIIATSDLQNKLVYFPNNGAGGFGNEQLIVGSLDGAGQVTTADINNDGNLDIAVVVFNDNKVVWYPGDGTGGFGSEEIIEIGTVGPTNISFGLFDEDADLDACVGFTGGTIEVYYNQYVESMTNTVSFVIDDNQVDSGNPFLFIAAFADVNDDGNLDIIKSDNFSGEVAWFNLEMDGTYTKHAISDGTIINRPSVAIVTDLNNDTYNDVILTDGGSVDDSVIWFESDSSGGLSTTETFINNDPGDTQTFGITIADFDNDGDKDIARTDWFNGALDWLENDLIVLGLNDNIIDKISIYPNPTTDKLYFKSTLIENFKVSVFDILGKKVIEDSVNTNKALDVSRLHTGIYIIRFDDYNTTFKFVKE